MKPKLDVEAIGVNDVGKDSVEDILGDDSDVADNVVVDTGVVDDGGSEFFSYVNSKQVHKNITEYHQSAEITSSYNQMKHMSTLFSIIDHTCHSSRWCSRCAVECLSTNSE